MMENVHEIREVVLTMKFERLEFPGDLVDAMPSFLERLNFQNDGIVMEHSWDGDTFVLMFVRASEQQTPNSILMEKALQIGFYLK